MTNAQSGVIAMKMTFTFLGALVMSASLAQTAEVNKINPGEENRGGTLPSSRFEVEDGYNIFLTTDFLWWRAQEDGLYFGQEGFRGTTTNNPPIGEQNFKGNLAKINPPWEPGVRIGLGGNMPYDEWDIFLQWTYFKTDARQSEHNGVIALWGHQNIDQNVTERAKANWNLDMYVLDAELGRSFWVGKYLSMRPFFGLRGAWLDQEFKVHYDFATNPIISTKIRANTDFYSGGLRGGVDMRYNLFGGWSFYGQSSFSMLYGRFICDFHEHENDTRIAKTEDEYHQGIFTTQMTLGVRWDTYVSHSRYHFTISAAWEQNIWFDVNQMNHFIHQLHEGNMVKGNGNLTTQGGTFGARFDF